MIDGTSSAEEKQSHLHTQSLSGKKKARVTIEIQRDAEHT